MILDKVLGKIEEALCITLNLEALDKSKDVETRATEDQIEQTERTKRDKYAKVAIQPGLVPNDVSARPAATSASSLTDDTLQQLREALGKHSHVMYQPDAARLHRDQAISNVVPCTVPYYQPMSCGPYSVLSSPGPYGLQPGTQSLGLYRCCQHHIPATWSDHMVHRHHLCT